MAAATKRARRTYLRAEQRREQLLAVAAELVEKRGWEALGMVPLAASAGVSRQLVYEHFENLRVLRAEVTRHLFEGMVRAAGETLVEHPDDFAAALRASLRLQLQLPPGVRLALRELIAGPAGADVTLRRRRSQARERVTELWAEPIRRGTGIGEGDARALAWVLIVASWSLFDLVADGTFSADGAAEFFVEAARGAIAALARDG